MLAGTVGTLLSCSMIFELAVDYGALHLLHTDELEDISTNRGPMLTRLSSTIPYTSCIIKSTIR